MATINVRRLDDEVVRRLKLRAAENNRSLESEARHILEQAAEDDAAARARRFRDLSQKLREMTKGTVQTPSEVLIREDREHGHRDF
jgi:plasmid stability protein